MNTTVPTLTTDPALSRLRTLPVNDAGAASFRTALDAFRQAGFLQVALSRIRQNTPGADVKEPIEAAAVLLEESIARRLLPNPLEAGIAAEMVFHEIESMRRINECLGSALEKASRLFNHGKNDGGRIDYIRVLEICHGFVSGINLILNADMPFVAHKNDSILREHGVVFLESQGLRIKIGPLTDRIGLHTAYIGPGKNFGHIHSSALSTRPNWEYHFVLPGQNGSHVVGGYRCAMDARNGDIVGVPINTPHGGFNHGDTPLELHFCAGGDIPWDYPPKDLAPHDVTKSVMTDDLSDVNGIPLGPLLDECGEGTHTIIDPRNLGDSYGIELQAVVAGDQGVSWESGGDLIQVWSGEGSIGIEGTTMRSALSPGDKCALLKGLRYRITPHRDKMILLKFAMKDF
jgi:hypothetical protein